MKRILAHSWWVLALVASTAITAPVQAGSVNLLANPGFEDAGGSYDGWFKFGTGPDTSNTIFRSGAASAKVEGEFTAGFSAGGIDQRFGNLTPGAEYVFSGYGYISSADTIPGTNTCDFNRLIAKLVYLDSGSNEIQANECVIGDWNTPRDQWVQFSLSSPVPSGADSIRVLLLYLQPDIDPGAVHVDDLSLSEETPTAFPNLLVNGSFSSFLTGWTVFGNVFPEVGGALIHSLPGSGKMFGAFSLPGATTIMLQSFSATPGMDYHANLYSYTNCLDGVTQNDNFSLAVIKFFSAGVAIDSVEIVVSDSTSKPFVWTQYSMMATAPSGTDAVEFALVFVQPNLFDGGAVFYDDVSFYEMAPVSVDLTPRELNFTLRQNAPNPFGSNTRIDFVLEQREIVDISVYDISGRRIATLANQLMPAGRHSIQWDGRMSNGLAAGTGIYRYMMKTSAGSISRSMTLIK